MSAERFWNLMWLFAFPVLLAALSRAFLPETSIFQFLVLPLWAIYWNLTRPSKQALWVSLWHAVLCEALWLLPPGACVTFALVVWWIIRTYRDLLPIRPAPYHGLLCGVIVLPVLRLWIWLYAILWPTATASYLCPTFAEFILIPTVGALGGSAIFALAQKTEFRIFIPKADALRNDED